MTVPDRLRQAAQQAIKAHDELLEAWRAWSRESKPAMSAGDIPLLRELIYRKVYPINAFEVLARLDEEEAISSLLARYLGVGVDPDSGFGGFVFDISTMLSDLIEIGGETAFLKLLHHPRFNPEMLTEARFVASACDALQIDRGTLPKWLADHPPPARDADPRT